ncbi:SGNH/GDSL hydrolase family protein [Planctomycetaceae bacterium SH139]
MPSQNQFTMLALGDSYTIGEGVEPGDRWPLQLTAELATAGIPFHAPQIIAKTGWTTDELTAGIKSAKVHKRYDWVTLLIGVNNQYRERDVEAFRVEFIELLTYAIEKADNNPGRVIVLSIPDWGTTPFAADRDRGKIAQQIDLYNKVKQSETERLQAHFVDITDISRQATEQESGLLAADGLHPSATMYRQWVKRVVPIMLDISR